MTRRVQTAGRSEAAGPPSTPTDRAERVGRELQAAFAALLEAFPPRVGSIAEMTRWLDVGRSVCQRVVLGVRDAEDGLEVIERFPGLRGLEQFLDACQRRACAERPLGRARGAFDAYAALIAEAGGSHARLVGEIEVRRAERSGRAASAEPSDRDTERWRRQCYEGFVGLTGLSSAARVEVMLVRPVPGDPEGRIESAGASGLIGVEALPHAMPLVRMMRVRGTDAATPADTATIERALTEEGITPGALLRRFTTEPLPTVTTRRDGPLTIQVFNPNGETAAPIDLVASQVFSPERRHPAAEDPRIYNVGRVLGVPARALVMDVYLHRSLAAQSIPSSSVIRLGLRGMLGNERPAKRWFDVLPEQPDVVLLGDRLGARHSAAYRRLADLTRYIGDEMDWAGEPWVGYRLEVAYPICDVEYVLSFDFSEV